MTRVFQLSGIWQRECWRFSNLPANTVVAIFRVSQALIQVPRVSGEAGGDVIGQTDEQEISNKGMATISFILRINYLNKNRIYELWTGKDLSRKQSWPSPDYYPGTCLEGLCKITRNLGQDCWCWSFNLSQISPEHKLRTLQLYQPTW
jgi:hypothetical protein